ncbi:MAG: Lrp/AsnC family transcriptional regulator [Candidatus Woesearchaeota archaeon]|nr:Lrp/AsnC family transcriptional regulator [Candidatus Woesearchaeota archaeon]
MNPNEKEIIKCLRHGKRVNVSAIAREMKLPVSTVADKIRKIDRKYVIKRSSLLDYPALGYLSHHMLAVKVNGNAKQEFLDCMKEDRSISSIYHTNSNFTFLLEIVCKDSYEFVRWIENIRSKYPVDISSFQILKVEDKERFMPE